MKVLVAGGTGFVGRALCRELGDRGHAVTAASRSADDADLPAGIEGVTLDVTADDPTSLVAGHDAVVNLVALASHVQPRGREHDAVHRAGTQALVRACEATGVGRFVQLSALGVDSDVQTDYFEAKRAAEAIVRGSDLESVIYRPSVVFGDGAGFLEFLRRFSAARIVPLPGGGRMRIQPLWVEDLAPMLAAGVTDDDRAGDCYRLGGPEVLTLAETVRLVRPEARIVPVPMPLARVGATVAEVLPGVPIGRDQYRVQRLDNTVADNDVTAFGIEEDALSTLSAYLDRDGRSAATGRARPAEEGA